MKAVTIFSFLLLVLGASKHLEHMNKMFDGLIKLLPYMASEESFKSPGNEKVIKENINQLYKTFNAVKHEAIMEKDLYSPVWNVTKDELQSIKDNFDYKNKSYALIKLRELSSQCIDCHTRSSSANAFNENWILEKSDFKNFYEQGVANLIVRQYGKAREAFVNSIEENLKNGDIEEIEPSLRQVLLIDLRARKRPEALMNFLEGYLKNKKIQGTVRVYLNAWIDRLKYWNINHPVISEPRTEPELTAFGEKFLDFEKLENLKAGKEIDLLIIDGILSRYLIETPHTAKSAQLNYWLGKIGIMLEKEGFFKTGAPFLKQCITKYKGNVIAPKCFEEYEKWVKKKSFEKNPEEEELERMRKFLMMK